MAVYTTTLDADGSILIPPVLRDQMGIKDEDPVKLMCDEFGIALTKILAADADEWTDAAKKSQVVEGE